uniref:Uncharacterized protein n=1 Tax=Hemiselmis andersenii TaxID=464988 RepID=A0A6U2G2Q8_HEMAN
MGGRAAALVVAASALALVGVALVGSKAVSSRVASVLIDKQQQAWYDGTSVYQEDHHPLASRGRSGRRQELRTIDHRLSKAVKMINELEEGGDHTLLAADHKEMSATHQQQLSLREGQALPVCFKKNDINVDRQTAEAKMAVAADNLAMSYPTWAKGAALTGKGQDGEWRHDRGPPYVMRVTLFSGDGVDTKGSGTLVRRILGLKTAFGKPCDLRSCRHAWSNNNYLTSFDGPQFRFLYRNMCSVLVVPPLTNGAGPILSENGIFRLHHYLRSGHNSLIVLGGVANVLFLNQNYVDRDGGLSLEPNWVEGPYEAQDINGVPAAKGTPFESLSVTLPSPGVSVVGVKLSTLPANAISYFEAQDTSVVFEIPTKTGRIIYIGYDFSEPITPWIHTLVAATNFPDYAEEKTPKRAYSGSKPVTVRVGPPARGAQVAGGGELAERELAEAKREKAEAKREKAEVARERHEEHREAREAEKARREADEQIRVERQVAAKVDKAAQLLAKSAGK